MDMVLNVYIRIIRLVSDVNIMIVLGCFDSGITSGPETGI